MNPDEVYSLLSYVGVEPPDFRRDLMAVVQRHQRYNVTDGVARTVIERGAANRQIGFAGGWVSFHYMRKGLLDAGVAWSDNEIAAFLARIGYVKHPGLRGGRPNNPVQPDRYRTRLFVKPDHYSTALGRPCDIERAYSRDQGYRR